MDCEKFDLHAMDALYAELDELTNAALKRHMDGCARCYRMMSGFRATRSVGLLPIAMPSDGFEERIFAAADAAQRKAPWHKRAVRLVAWAGSHAMRPQLAAAAVLLIILGSSVLLLRPKPGSMAASPVSVTERGVPAPDPESDHVSAVEVAAPSPPAPPIAAASAASPAEPAIAPPATEAVAIGSPGAAATGSLAKAAATAEAGDDADAARTLAEARAQRDKAGCLSALPGFDKVGASYPGTPQAADAMWDAANCYKSTGDSAKAHELFMALSGSSKYRMRAAQEVAQSTPSNSRQAAGVPAAAAVARVAAPMPAPAAAPRPSAPAQADEASKPSTGGAIRNNAAPSKRPALDY